MPFLPNSLEIPGSQRHHRAGPHHLDYRIGCNLPSPARGPPMTADARTSRAETIGQVLILLLIAGMAGAASFTHVHDWTMHNAPPGTGTWFGWANAVISELTPTAAGIDIRRRKRHHQPIGYPITVLIAAAILSL